VVATAMIAMIKTDFLIFLGILINNKSLVQVDLPGSSKERDSSLKLKAKSLRPNMNSYFRREDQVVLSLLLYAFSSKMGVRRMNRDLDKIKQYISYMQ
jgi:hypothetical protein